MNTKSIDHISNPNTLISMLKDDDDTIASLTMEAMLKHPDVLDIIANFQDSTDKNLRRRIQQLSSLLNLEKTLQHFKSRLATNDLSVWEAALLIDRLYDPQTNPKHVNSLFDDLLAQFTQQEINLENINAYIAQQDFRLNDSANAFLSTYLLGDVLDLREGASFIMGIILHKLCSAKNVPCNFCIFNGHIALIGKSNRGRQYIIDIGDHMNSYQNVNNGNFSIINQDIQIIAYMILQMFSCAIISGNTWDINFTLVLLNAIKSINRQNLAYPIGNAYKQEMGKW